MQRRARTRANWTPVVVSNTYRAAEDDKVVKGEAVLRVVHSESTPSVQTQEEDRLADNRFMIAAAIALTLPAVIGVSLYMTAIIILRVI